MLALHEIGPDGKAALPSLKNALADGEQGARVHVAKAIWRIDQQPDDVIPVLAKALENGDEEERYESAEQLQAMGAWAAPAVPALIKALKDTKWTNRSHVAQALGEIGPQATAAIPALTKALQSDEDRIVRSNAAEALGKIGDPQAIDALISALDNEDDFVRFKAVDALEAFGHKAKAAVPAMIRVVNDNKANAWNAVHALGAIDADGISTPVLIEAFGSNDSTARRFAASALHRLGRKANSAERVLHDGLGDSDPDVRVAAAAAYWSVSGEADDSVDVLRSVLQARNKWTTQMGAAGALGEIGPAAKDAVPELITCLKSDTRYVVTSSATALGRIGPDAALAVPALTAQLQASDDQYTRASLARALWRINRSGVSLPVLQEVLKGCDDSMAVSEAARAIGEMGPPAIGSAPLLRPLLKDSSSHVRDAAAEALKQIERQRR